MLICPKCQTEYAEGKKYCKNCGSPLVLKEKMPSSYDSMDKGPKDELIQTLICQNCKIFYKKGKFCKKCGSPLVVQGPPKKEEEPKASYTPEVKMETQQIETIEKPFIESLKKNLFCPNCKIFFEAGKFCKKCGSPLVMDVTQFEKKEIEILTPRLKEEKVVSETHPKDLKREIDSRLKTIRNQQQQLSILPNDREDAVRHPQKGRMKLFRPLLLAAGTIVVLIAITGYLLWPKYSYLIIKRPLPIKETPTEVTSPEVPPSSISATSGVQGSDLHEVVNIKALFENIRQANLEKNIDLFMDCYSTDFKGREDKKISTLKSWNNFDYIDLSYNLVNQSISGDIANIRVEWLMKFSLKSGGQPQERKSVLDVILKKEQDIWKIKEVRPVS